ncbi:hypothetical protein BALOs_2932 [Halobacteriovorax sp. BALOs_7]|nr:hypothetical protein BALOs_2932 [Halobacteriovorax sp. BALOs_7]
MLKLFVTKINQAFHSFNNNPKINAYDKTILAYLNITRSKGFIYEYME